MLTDEVELQAAVRVRPEPTFRPIKPRAVVIAARKIPEWNRHRISSHPFPVLWVLAVPYGAQPVLSSQMLTMCYGNCTNKFACFKKRSSFLK
jgi:hypothetical protein